MNNSTQQGLISGLWAQGLAGCEQARVEGKAQGIEHFLGNSGLSLCMVLLDGGKQGTDLALPETTQQGHNSKQRLPWGTTDERQSQRNWISTMRSALVTRTESALGKSSPFMFIALFSLSALPLHNGGPKKNGGSIWHSS